MLDVKDAECRRRLSIHAAFKSSVYGQKEDCSLFIESDHSQAKSISYLTNKPVLCFSTMTLFKQPQVRAPFADLPHRLLHPGLGIKSRLTSIMRRLGTR